MGVAKFILLSVLLLLQDVLKCISWPVLPGLVARVHITPGLPNWIEGGADKGVKEGVEEGEGMGRMHAHFIAFTHLLKIPGKSLSMLMKKLVK